MENKYYTPDISEFRVGFEYECLEHIYGNEIAYSDSIKDEFKWIPIIFGKHANDNDDLNFEFKYQIHNSFYTRVKYLDREDIESLGFEYVGNNHPLGTGCIEYFTGKYYKGFWCHIRYTKFSNRCVLTIETSVEKDSVRTLVVHSIGIKNKSELKVLLKQLGINE